MRRGWIILALLIANALDAQAANSPPISITVTVRSMAGGRDETDHLDEVVKPTSIKMAGQEIRRENNSCASVDHVWALRSTVGKYIRIFRVDCSTGELYQLTIMDNKPYVKPWNGDLIGD